MARNGNGQKHHAENCEQVIFHRIVLVAFVLNPVLSPEYMSRSELSSINEMCSRFLRDTVPEYVSDAAKYILSDNGVQKINIQEGETWEVRARSRGKTFRYTLPHCIFR